jgi:hypothetical protein
MTGVGPVGEKSKGWGGIQILQIITMTIPLIKDGQHDTRQSLIKPLSNPPTGYGLFRRMTGVGPVGKKSKGWGGQPASVVARPEIILYGLDPSADYGSREAVENDRNWREIEFRFKPGDVATPPKFCAPYQPRLDWQVRALHNDLVRHTKASIHLAGIG